MSQGQDVLTCPTIANNHQKTSICEVFLFEMMRDQWVCIQDFISQKSED